MDGDDVFKNEFTKVDFENPLKPKEKRRMTIKEKTLIGKSIVMYKPRSKIMKNHWNEMGLVQSKKFGLPKSRSVSRGKSGLKSK